MRPAGRVKQGTAGTSGLTIIVGSTGNTYLYTDGSAGYVPALMAGLEPSFRCVSCCR